MTKQEFYDFAMMMKRDSNILFDSNSLHNSVYLGAFVLEAYIKILFINNGANTPRGQSSSSYGGHINDGRMVERLQTLFPSVFSNSILEVSSDKFPTKLLSSEYDINYRYEVNRWIDPVFCQEVQNEIEQVKNALERLEMDGAIQ
jgi:hypothetical protein